MTLETQFCPDVITTIPSYPNTAFVGTYQLQEDRSYTGSIDTLLLSSSPSPTLSTTLLFDSGVFDIVHHNDRLYSCHTNGSIKRFLPSSTGLISQDINKVSSSTLTSLSFCNDTLFLSAANGDIIRCNSATLEPTNTIQSHSYDSWCVLGLDSSTCLSGGDDAKLNVNDFRSNSVTTSFDFHEAGVTSLLASQRESVFFSGSYDDYLIEFDLRNKKRPINKTKLPGGVWDIFPTTFSPDHLACVCMYGGAVLLNNERQVVWNSATNDQLIYGFDVLSDGSCLIADFYGKSVSLDKIKL
ncbi:hypothetical protein RCL1_006169 [Eukaryota sp. TZLM3-RCL]